MWRSPRWAGYEGARQLAVPDRTSAATGAAERPATSRMLVATAERTCAHVCAEIPPAPDVVAIGAPAAACMAYRPS